MAATTTGIPTLFDGIEYRSRLEARWAAWFTRLGWDFTYEPFDGHGYVPDFLVKADRGVDQGFSLTYHLPWLRFTLNEDHKGHVEDEHRPFLVEIKPAITGEDYMQHCDRIDEALEGVWDGNTLVLGVDPFPSCFPGEGFVVGWFGWAVPARDRPYTTGPRIWRPLTVESFEAAGHDSKLRIIRALLQRLWADACNDVKWRGHDAR